MAKGSDADNSTDYSLIATTDTSTETDYLGFEPYVKSVVSFVTHRNTEAPLTLSIEGAWGTGKSSFLKQCKAELDDKKDDENLTVYFNPWKYEEGEDLWAAFALEFIQQVRANTSCERRKLGDLKLFWRRFKWKGGTIGAVKAIASVITLIALLISIILIVLFYGSDISSTLTEELSSDSNRGAISFLIGSGGLITALAAIVAILGSLGRFLRNPIGISLEEYLDSPDYSRETSFLTHFHNDFERLVQSYANGSNVYVFIDDLDRCETPKAAELMQSLNLLMANDSHIIFILAIDRTRVAASIAAKDEDLIPYLQGNRQNSVASLEHEVGLEYGYQYLEKFIQVPILIPNASESDIQNMINKTTPEQSDFNDNQMETIEGVLDNKLDEIIEFVSPALGNNPRQVIRFVNLFRLRIRFGVRNDLIEYGQDRAETEAGEVTIEQLAKFVAISIQWPRLLAQLSVVPEMLRDLEEVALSEEGSEYEEMYGSFATDQRLLNLLKHGITSPSSEETQEEFSLRNVDVSELLKISPRTDRPETTIVSGRDIVKVLTKHGFEPVSRVGSHVELRWEPDTESEITPKSDEGHKSETDAINGQSNEFRTVIVPLHDKIRKGTLTTLARQAGAKDFDSFIEWIEDNK